MIKPALVLYWLCGANGTKMVGQIDFTADRVSAAIRAGLPSRPDVVLTDLEAAELVDTYRESLAHYREHVQKSQAEGDFRQVAEKSWGAYTQAIKAIAADHRWRVRSHANILRVSERLTSLALNANPEIGAVLDVGANSAHSLHIHFCENDLPDETVSRRAESTAGAIDLLQELFGTGCASR